MSGPYAFNRMANGEVLYAPKINELQQGIEELGAEANSATTIPMHYEVLDDCTDPDAWTVTNSGTLTSYTADPVHPLALEISTPPGDPGNYTTVHRDLVTSLDGRFLAFWMKLLDGNFQRIGIGLSVDGREFSSRFETEIYGGSFVVGRWRRVSIPNPAYAANGSPTPTASSFGDVRAIWFQVFPQSGEVAEIQIAAIRAYDYVLPSGCVWCFDDGKESTFDTAFPVLQSAGYRGTIAIETGNVGASGYCSLVELQEMQDAGWQMVSHTVTGGSLNSADMGSVRTQLRDSYNYLMANGFVSGAKHFVYPGGIWDEDILIETLRHYRTARTAGGQSFTTPGVAERGLLQPYYFTTSVPLATAKSALDTLAARGGVAYLVFHELVESPAITEDWSIADFSELVSHARSIGLRSYVPSEVWP